MYKHLPSYVQANATTYDLMVMDVMLSWEQKKEDERNGKLSTPKLSQQQMMDMIKRVRSK
jgi:hypothetical protein